ncbi:ABC transporter ATP-binding protein [Candidatus Spongiisocius sp.]|uniref:ABC transporter ATP-binding protein n=1 Tax=Candidatus Spongiisocius sp. TaxID=3101273 RepID=UPI003B59DED7
MSRLLGGKKRIRATVGDVGPPRQLPHGHPAVRVEGVTKIYNEDTPQQLLALDNISMEIAQGEVVALLGPSGCGKSTLLKMIGGLYPPTGGRILVDGVPVTEPGELTGMMFQKPVLFPWLKVVDNVLLPVRTQGAKRSEFLDRALDLIALAGLQGFEESYPWELSGGMQQRVAICRMLMGEPRVLLLDEPFGALDEMTREYMDLELRRIIIRQNRSALLVTHNPLEAAFIGDRVVVMTSRPGKIAGEVEVPLGKDRSEDLLASDELNVYIREARSLLELAKDSMGRPL